MLYLTLSKLWFANIRTLTTDGYTSRFGASSSQYTTSSQFHPSGGEQILGNVTYFVGWSFELHTTSILVENTVWELR